jgi:hypothetical protein
VPDDSSAIMASQPMPPQMPQQMPALNVDRYVVIHVATTCDEHGVYVTKDSAEVIELGWILLDANSLEEVRGCLPASPMLASLSRLETGLQVSGSAQTTLG